MRRTTEYIILSALLGLTGLAQAGDIRVNGKFVSEATSGPPLVVNSADVVPSLNADKLDGFDVGDFATPDSGAGVHWKNLVGVPGEEIDQDCAEFTGCFSGDDPGFPVTITSPGSYRLAGVLDVSALADTHVIQIQASNVSLDLNGFAITGPGTCTGTPVTSCTPSSGTGNGIQVDSDLTDIAIGHGSIRGMWFLAIQCDSSCRIQDISVTENLGHGIIMFATSGSAENCKSSRNAGTGFAAIAVTIDNCHFHGNGDIGIQTQGTIVNSTATSNGAAGIKIENGIAHGNTTQSNLGAGLTGTGTAKGNAATNNGGDGFVFVGTFIGNDSRGNSGDGISGLGSFIQNHSRENDGDGINAAGTITGNTSHNNEGHGILVRAIGRSKVADNTARQNGGYGIECATDCLVLNNGMFSNTAGALRAAAGRVVWGRNFLMNNAGTLDTVDGTNTSLGDNVCTSTTC